MPINLYDHSIIHELQPLVRLPNQAVAHFFTFLYPTPPPLVRPGHAPSPTAAATPPPLFTLSPDLTPSPPPPPPHQGTLHLLRLLLRPGGHTADRGAHVQGAVPALPLGHGPAAARRPQLHLPLAAYHPRVVGRVRGHGAWLPALRAVRGGPDLQLPRSPVPVHQKG